jgi:hypothetical protein
MSTKLERISNLALENRELKFLSIAHLLTRTVRERLVEMIERRVKARYPLRLPRITQGWGW